MSDIGAIPRVSSSKISLHPERVLEVCASHTTGRLYLDLHRSDNESNFPNVLSVKKTKPPNRYRNGVHLCAPTRPWLEGPLEPSPGLADIGGPPRIRRGDIFQHPEEVLEGWASSSDINSGFCILMPSRSSTIATFQSPFPLLFFRPSPTLALDQPGGYLFPRRRPRTEGGSDQ